MLRAAAAAATVLVADATLEMAFGTALLPSRLQSLLCAVFVVSATVGFLGRRVEVLFGLGRRVERSASSHSQRV